MTRITQTLAAHGGPAEGGLTTFVPLRFRRHGVKKVVMHAQPTQEAPLPVLKVQGQRADPKVVKAIAQGLYWQQLLNEQKVRGASEIARVEATDRGRVTKLMRVAVLAPDLITAIVDGKLPVTLQRLLRHEIPVDWEQQRQLLIDG